MTEGDVLDRCANFGLAWLLLCLAFMARFVDAALTDFELLQRGGTGVVRAFLVVPAQGHGVSPSDRRTDRGQ
jgi:hypothetical protein